jgi:hypothetical protein
MAMRGCTIGVFVLFGCASGLRLAVDVQKPTRVAIDDTGLSFGAGCPNPQQPKLAVCVAGLSRSFVSSETTSRFVNQLLKPAIEAGAVGITRKEPDVFVHIKLGENSKDKAVEAVAAVHTTDSQIEDGSALESRSNLGNPSCFHPHWSGGSIESLMSFYKSIHGCYKLLTDAEQKSGAKFDHVIFMRPDHLWATSTEGHGPKTMSFGGADHISNRIQCSKSIFAADLYSFQTRAAFEHYGKIWEDQFANPNPSFCNMTGRNEQMVINVVKEINNESPHSAVYGDDRITTDGSKDIWIGGQ